MGLLSVKHLLEAVDNKCTCDPGDHEYRGDMHEEYCPMYGELVESKHGDKIFGGVNFSKYGKQKITPPAPFDIVIESIEVEISHSDTETVSESDLRLFKKESGFTLKLGDSYEYLDVKVYYNFYGSTRFGSVEYDGYYDPKSKKTLLSGTKGNIVLV